jgi:putative ATPase
MVYEAKDLESMPLAERMRPRDFKEFIGQKEVVGLNTLLRKSIEKDTIQSVILWGPPGCGKTTLAKIIAKNTKSYFQDFLPVAQGVADVREIVALAKKRYRFNGQKTILFVDEIHRFNKGQQDVFLPYVEDGSIILVGATTENPSFDIITPLQSRSIVVPLKPLDGPSMAKIIRGALKDKERGLGKYNVAIKESALKNLVIFADGDARNALNLLEFIVVNYSSTSPDKKLIVDNELLKTSLPKQIIRYDKKGDSHYDIISAFIKSMRDSNPDAAIYWLARMLAAGEDIRFIARRMIIFACEDIDHMDEQAIVVANSVAQAVEYVGLPEARIILAHGVTYLATAKKDNASYMAVEAALKDVETQGNLPVPLHLRNAVTNLMKNLGYGEGYKYPHESEGHITDQGEKDLPEKLRGKKYYKPREQ